MAARPGDVPGSSFAHGPSALALPLTSHRGKPLNCAGRWLMIVPDMGSEYRLEAVARIPLPGDNCAIATHGLEAGTRVISADRTFRLSAQVLEGHRFAVEDIREEQPLLSWGLPFGYATRPIRPGEYVFNAAMSKEMSYRELEFDGRETNFQNDIRAFQLDPLAFVPASQVELYSEPRSFRGFQRSGKRGAGTRNYIIILATNSRTSSFVRLVDEKLKPELHGYPNVDGVVSVAHTEGGADVTPNNRAQLLRTLAGFIVHPNVGAVLVVDSPESPVSNLMLDHYLKHHGYPVSDLLHRFHNLEYDVEREIETCCDVIRQWLPLVNQSERSLQPMSEIKAALQCGGSDAFSGVSANPLASWVAREIIRNGGAANHAETDELIGAESYMLLKVRTLDVAQRFLAHVERYKEMASWHGVTAEGNPSGGNKLRGLYNIALKSIGAGLKRHPDVRLDDVLDYSERIPGPGFYFMDSPGNDLESIAGQVGSGANLIFFTTGNGSVTNFPFVPTIKIVTTTPRYDLLEKEMDVNAGEYLDGVPMDTLGRRTFELACSVASGERTRGEKSGHYQVSIWRDWRQRDRSRLQVIQSQPLPAGNPLPFQSTPGAQELRFRASRTPEGHAADQVGLILPTSLCASQVSVLIARQLNQRLPEGPLSRVVAIPHSEGCGYTSGETRDLFLDTLVSYLMHPAVGAALLLEHGCDKIHNGVVRSRLVENGLDPARFGTASIQLDGGLERVSEKVIGWFESRQRSDPRSRREEVGIGCLSIGILSEPPIGQAAARGLIGVVSRLVENGTTVVVPENDEVLDLLSSDRILESRPDPTLAYGAVARKAGFHVMANPGRHWAEALTGLAACGASLILGYHGSRPQAGHPLVPLLRISAESDVCTAFGADLDLVLEGKPNDWADQMAQLVVRAASQEYQVRALQTGHTDVQFTRGLLGFSS